MSAATLGLLASALAATGAPANPWAYALVVASSAPGSGQQALKYSLADAERLTEVLVQLGRYPKENVELLVDPRREQLVSALARARSRLQAHQTRGEQSSLLFYYSGHAKAQALTLGAEELSVAELRDALDAPEGSLVVAILDACQSGAVSGIKGVEAAASFSVNSVARMATEGLAVLASSTGNELSQESSALKGSYFTHNLVAGLRGAADVDGDGRVTLSEAYRYAYGQTLVATSATAVGGQHATLETNLKGKGEVPLSYPKDASAALSLQAALVAEVVIASGDSIIAELHKGGSGLLSLGLPPGDYQVLVRQTDGARSCQVRLAKDTTTVLELDRCPMVTVGNDTAKGAVAEPGSDVPWGFELSGGLFGSTEDQYLTTFMSGYYFVRAVPYRARFSVSRDLGRTFTVLLDAQHLESMSFSDTGDNPATASFSTLAVGVSLRANFRLWEGRFVPYVQLGAGVAWAVVRFHTPSVAADNGAVTDVGYDLGIAAGSQLLVFKHLGVFLQAGYDSAPVVRHFNAFGGDSTPHQSGGFSGQLGLRVQL